MCYPALKVLRIIRREVIALPGRATLSGADAGSHQGQKRLSRDGMEA